MILGVVVWFLLVVFLLPCLADSFLDWNGREQPLRSRALALRWFAPGVPTLPSPKRSGQFRTSGGGSSAHQPQRNTMLLGQSPDHKHTSVFL